MSALLLLAILAITLGRTSSLQQHSPKDSSEILPKNHVYHFMESRGEMFGSTVERSTFSLRGMRSDKTNAPSPYPAVEQQTPVVDQKVLDPTSDPPSSLTANASVDNVVGLIEYQHPIQHAVSLQVFLLGHSTLMNAQSRSTFELAALQFIIDRRDQIGVSIESVRDLAVIDQKLTWSRLVNGMSSTGLEVYFEANAVSGNVAQNELEQAMQIMLDSKAKAFRRNFNLALGGPADEPESTTTTEFSLEPMAMPLGMSALVAGCVSFIAILIISVRLVGKEIEQEKDLSKTSIEEENDVAAQRQSSYPVQQATGHPEQLAGPIWDSDSSESDVMSTVDDNTFLDSLIFCPSVDKELKDVSTLFNCSRSGIDNMESASDSDSDGSRYEYSPIQRNSVILTMDDLSNFDNEMKMRRVEC